MLPREETLKGFGRNTPVAFLLCSSTDWTKMSY